MNINKNVFRAYDIRGKAEVANGKEPDLTPDLFERIGFAAAKYLIENAGLKRVIVGRDNRSHGVMLQNALMKGLSRGGMHVVDVGLATSPMIYFATCYYPETAGAVVTASHNPKDDNGLKLVRNNAHCIAGEELQEILTIIEGLEDSLFEGNDVFQFEEKSDLFDDYLSYITSKITLNGKLKVVVDCGNGVAGKFAPVLLSTLGAEVIQLYCDLDSNFPNHEANPEQPKNMIDLGKKVLETNAHLGIGFDGDGDRIGVVDENGKFQSIEYPMILLVRNLLMKNPGEKIIFDVKISQLLIDEILNNHGLPIMSKTGHSFMEKRLREEAAPLAGEKSGHLFFGKRHYDYLGFDDAFFAACKLLEVLSLSDKPYSKHFENLPLLYNTPEEKAFCPDERKIEIIENVKEYFSKKYDCILIDGVRINFDNSSWGLVRASNTSPAFTLLFEASTKERLNEIRNEIFDFLRNYTDVVLP